MAEIKKQPNAIWQEFQDAKEYNSNIELYDNVEKNERFYHGDQWYGVNAPNMMKPVFNLVKRVSNYFIAMLVSDDISINISPFDESEQNVVMAKVLSREIESIVEKTKLKAKQRINVKNCCIDGDTGLYITFDPDIETGQDVKGDIEIEVVDNIHILFGNPYSGNLQKQPYILIVQRLYTDTVKEMAKANGMDEDTVNDIVSDDEDEVNYDGKTTSKLTTVITKMWKVKEQQPDIDVTTGQPKVDLLGKPVMKNVETVKYIKTARNVVIKDETNTGYTMYPFSYMSWEDVKNSYHGRSPITGLLPNQIFINKMFAMVMVYLTNMGFPRVLYDTNKIKQLSNDVTKASGVQNLDMLGKVMDAAQAPDFSSQVNNFIDATITYTKDFMGASDAALGNVQNPDNTSAIIAVQQASSVPLQIQRLAYYDFIEEAIRVIIDIISVDYGKRKVKITNEEAETLGLYQKQVDPMTGQIVQGEPQTSIEIDFSTLKYSNYKLNVDIGQSTYWSETTQVQTLDNLFNKGILTDAITYLEGIPDKYITNKQKIIDSIKENDNTKQTIQMLIELLQQNGIQLPEQVMAQLNG